MVSTTAGPALADAVVATVKALGAAVPPPRHDPFHGLDRADGASVRALARLTRHGDFRKYVHVLDAGAGLGGSARWLASRYGCRVLALDRDAGLVAAGRVLSRRAGLGERVRGAAGTIEAIPVRDGVFTQIWSVEALDGVRPSARAVAELFRVLRPGSTLALQIAVAGDDTETAGRTWSALLHDAGFSGVISEPVPASEREESSPIVLTARARLARALVDTGAAALVPRLRYAAPDGPLRAALHLFARRPSV